MPVSSEIRERWAGIRTSAGDLKSDRIATMLEQQILSGDLTAGTMLPAEAEFCDILGVSRTVWRDAMRTLVARGLLVVSRGRGTSVAVPSDDAFANAMTALLARSGVTMGEVMRARDTVEATIVALAAEAGTADDWRRLRSAYDALARAVSSGDGNGAAAAHAEFHLGILDAAHQPALAIILAPMSKVAALTGVASVRRGQMQDWEVEAHLPILDALESGDAQAAQDAMHAHFAESTRPSTYERFLAQPFAAAYYGQPDPPDR
jgi:GntR family transcriptional regulator, transcriptional repressor for pyruvate dehydrogenase complex